MSDARPGDASLGCCVAAIPLAFLLLWLLWRVWFWQFYPVP